MLLYLMHICLGLKYPLCRFFLKKSMMFSCSLMISFGLKSVLSESSYESNNFFSSFDPNVVSSVDELS